MGVLGSWLEVLDACMEGKAWEDAAGVGVGAALGVMPKGEGTGTLDVELVAGGIRQSPVYGSGKDMPQ